MFPTRSSTISFLRLWIHPRARDTKCTSMTVNPYQTKYCQPLSQFFNFKLNCITLETLPIKAYIWQAQKINPHEHQ